MKRRRAPDHGESGRLSPIGRAERFECPPEGELWRLPLADEPVAGRLLQLGESHVGGFVDGGAEDESLWLLRKTSAPALAELLRARKGPWPWQEALSLAHALSLALAACEKAALFPGPLTPDAILVPGPLAFLSASPLVGALVGAPDAVARATPTVSPLWIPPAQADGAVWDAAANRYALGLLLYRLLSGEHPFAGAGLRHALGDAAHRDVPPFRETVAATLPAGLQSLTLRLLDPTQESRAATVADDLAAFVTGASPKTVVSGAPRQPGRAVRSESTEDFTQRPQRNAKNAKKNPASLRSSRSSAIHRHWPIAAGAVIALGSLLVLAKEPTAETSSGQSTNQPKVTPEPPLTQARTAAADCASCHPRQAAEWRRSVMAHAVKSPLFNALESLIEEQVGRDDTCPNGAGILRRVDPATACRDPKSNLPVTGSGGEHWCVNCHAPSEKLGTLLPPWEGRAAGSARSRLPVRDLLGDRPMEGISCGFCHQVHGPVPARGAARGAYEGNAVWTSFISGQTFAARPEDGRGLTGIGNSGYDLRPEDFLAGRSSDPTRAVGAHLRPPRAAKAYLRSSEFCGSCHDVRLFGTDVGGAAQGEHFKRLRNAYSEWAVWAKSEARAGRAAATCQDCHMSQFPGVCEADPPGTTSAGHDGGAPLGVPRSGPERPAPPAPAPPNPPDPECPPGSHFASRPRGAWPEGRVADNSAEPTSVVTHWFSGVDVPLSREFPAALIDEATLDLHGIPLSARRRRDMLLRHTFRFGLGAARRGGLGLEIPVEIENTGAGHRVPAGFSQEREFWVHLTVRDGDGRTVYEVGRVERGDEDLRDKVFVRVNVRGDERDGRGHPLGLFGADVRDGPDVPLWQPPPSLGGTSFRGRGLVNFQNGFLRCVRCIGTVAADGHCEAGPGQADTRAARFVDGDYDLDTGACRSNLSGANALFETYFPIGALDASRGLAKGPDAIIDTRSLPPGVPLRYVYDLPTGGRRGPFKAEARLLFRAFPPFLIKGFAAYEREQARRGLRPSGPLVTEDMLGRLEVVELARTEAEIR